MTEKTKNYLIYAIGFAFLAYGAMRLGVSGLLLMQAHGLLSLPDLQDGLNEVAKFMADVRAQALIPFSLIDYLIYMWVMGSLLSIGAIGCILKKSFGANCLYIFLTLYVLLFINFQVINPKIVHLAICALLLAIYKWLLVNKKEIE